MRLDPSFNNCDGDPRLPRVFQAQRRPTAFDLDLGHSSDAVNEAVANALDHGARSSSRATSSAFDGWPDLTVFLTDCR